MKRAALFDEDEIGLENLHPDCVLNVLVLYDSRDSAIRAKAIFDNLLNTFSNEFSFHCDYWRFDMLDLHEGHEHALEAAASADLILIAAHECAGISTSVKGWLFEWVAQKTEGTAAVVGLFERCDSVHAFENQVRSFLRPLARHVDFLFFEGPCRQPGQSEWTTDLMGMPAADLCNQ